MSKKMKLYIISAVLLLVGLGLGISIGKKMVSTPVVQSTPAPDNKIYTVQTAIIRGVVDQVNGNTLKVTNTNNNSTGDIMVSDHAVIANPAGKTTSSDPSTIQTGKPVVISLEIINDQYQAVSIQYMAPAPSVPYTMPFASSVPAKK